MSKPKSEIRTRDYIEESNDFFRVIQETSIEESKLEKLLSDLLTDSELRMLKRRWFIANLVSSGHTIREAAEMARVGSDTVMRVVSKIKKGSGILKEILLERVKNAKNSNLTKSNLYNKKKKNNSTKWFFGVK